MNARYSIKDLNKRKPNNSILIAIEFLPNRITNNGTSLTMVKCLCNCGNEKEATTNYFLMIMKIKLTNKQKEVIEEMRKENICMYKHGSIGTRYKGHYEVWDSARHRQVLRVLISTGNKLRDMGIITFVPNSMQDYFKLTELGKTINID